MMMRFHGASTGKKIYMFLQAIRQVRQAFRTIQLWLIPQRLYPRHLAMRRQETFDDNRVDLNLNSLVHLILLTRQERLDRTGTIQETMAIRHRIGPRF